MTKDKHTFRVKRLIVFSALAAIILAVTTYAWFIGMRTVNVTDFEVEIAVADDLLLSLDGANWDTTLKIDKTTIENIYPDSTNSWGGKGLVPMSSIGEMDITASRMKLFEKASLTASNGGYRLMASRVNNYQSDQTEQDGYVVFDIFIRNFSGTNYIEELNEADEEAIYLTTDSAVTVATAGSSAGAGSDGDSVVGVSGTGIENSVRVAFAQIGRVIGTTTDQGVITGINCDPAGNGEISRKDGVTGICRTAQIWEPNDTDHVQSAINWYSKSCKARTSATSWEGECNQLEDGKYYPTYAVRAAIYSSDKVDIYDGTEYNGYGFDGKLASEYVDLYPNPEESPYLLYPYDYFTDSEKDIRGVNRPPFMYLAPHSITKVRVYIWIEGQDVDNYDFAAIGRKISVKFGFTKQKMTAEDFGYTGPNEQDPRPNIILLGDKVVTISKDQDYVDAGAVAIDDKDKSAVLSENIVVEGIPEKQQGDTYNPGTYYITYNVEDSDGNQAVEVVRTLIILD